MRRAAGVEMAAGEARIVVVEGRRVVAARTVPRESLLAALEEAGAGRVDCSVAWSEGITHQFTTAPALRRAEQIAYLRRLEPDDATWELEELGPARIGEHPGVQVLAIRLPRAQQEEMARLPGKLRLRAVTSVALGLASLDALLPPLGGPVALASVSKTRAALVVVEGGRVRLVREFNAALLRDAPEALARELAGTVRYFDQTHHPLAVGRLAVAGAPALIGPLQALLPCPVLALEPLLGIEAEVSAVAFALALGLAAPNLLPPARRFRRERRGIVAAAALLFLAGAALVRGEQQAALAAAGRAEAQVARLEGLQRTAQPNLERELQWAARWRVVFERVAESHDRWARLAVGLANAAPQQLVFTRLDAGRRGDSVRVAVEARLTGDAPEQVARSFAAGVSALPHVRGFLIAPRLRGDLAAPRFEFDYESRDPLAPDDPRRPGPQ